MEEASTGSDSDYSRYAPTSRNDNHRLISIPAQYAFSVDLELEAIDNDEGILVDFLVSFVQRQ